MNMGGKKKVFVGLSGGVDSSVSAALLKERGFDVTGVFIKVWHPDFMPCDWKTDRRDAMRVCAKLDIPFETLDLEDEYKTHVVDYMVSEYKAGRTPNPDVMCNKHVKFGAFLKWAKEQGADHVATGHYAQIIKLETRNLNQEIDDTLHASCFTLQEGADNNKDQSYFLWTLTQEQLCHIIFPIGHLTKPDVRKLARKFGLPTAAKKDSQGLCFIGKTDMKDFLKHFVTMSPGKVLNEQGAEIGEHEGALFYTIGQRHGFTIIEKTPEDVPVYVIAKNIENNTITVSTDHPHNEAGEAAGVELEQVNFIREPESKKLLSRLRYRQEKRSSELDMQGGNVTVTFDVPQGGVATGQSLVLYEGEECVGGGVIRKILTK